MSKVGNRRVARTIGLIAGLIVLIVVLWLDIATGVWQDVVVLSGIAAGLVTFLLTALVLDRALAGAEHRRWLPVTRIALTDLLYTMADDQHSEVTRGVVVPRLLRLSGEDPEEWLATVYDERTRITETLRNWTGFLAGSADVRDLLAHIADAAEHLDGVMDAVLEFERTGQPAEREAITAAVEQCNERLRAVVDELQRLLNESQRISPS